MGDRIVVGIGEALWDVFPDARHLGGATLNFAYHAAALGERGIVAGRVGRDELGREIVATIKGWGLPAGFVQIDPGHPTGTVDVKLSPSGEPTFTITENVAWDFLAATPKLLDLARRADVVCFGSLCQRSETSRKTIQRFLARATNALIIYDINLRQTFYSEQVVRDSLAAAHILKLNDDETREVKRLLGYWKMSDDALGAALLRDFGLKMVCITRGRRGCVLHTARGRAEAPGYRVKVADTVGSGDAFTAALAVGYLKKYPLAKLADYANRVGAYVASRPGATPPVDLTALRALKL